MYVRMNTVILQNGVNNTISLGQILLTELTRVDHDSIIIKSLSLIIRSCLGQDLIIETGCNQNKDVIKWVDMEVLATFCLLVSQVAVGNGSSMIQNHTVFLFLVLLLPLWRCRKLGTSSKGRNGRESRVLFSIYFYS